MVVPIFVYSLKKKRTYFFKKEIKTIASANQPFWDDNICDGMLCCCMFFAELLCNLQEKSFFLFLELSLVTTKKDKRRKGMPTNKAMQLLHLLP